MLESGVDQPDFGARPGLGRARPISAGWATRKALRNRLLLALSPQDVRGIALWPVLCGQLAIACYGRL
jgi:hypothetical protein